MQSSFDADGARSRTELASLVALCRAESAAVATSASSEVARHQSVFREASQRELEYYHAATRSMCQEEEQQCFALATQELQMGYNKLFAERSERIVVQSRFQVEAAR